MVSAVETSRAVEIAVVLGPALVVTKKGSHMEYIPILIALVVGVAGFGTMCVAFIQVWRQGGLSKRRWASTSEVQVAVGSSADAHWSLAGLRFRIIPVYPDRCRWLAVAVKSEKIHPVQSPCR